MILKKKRIITKYQGKQINKIIELENDNLISVLRPSKNI